HVRVTEITVVAPKVQVLRRGPTEFDFSDLLDLFKGGEPSKEPSKWTVTLERLTVQRLTGVGRDQTTSPESVWRIDDLNLAANGLMIGPGAQPGRLQLSFKLNDAPIAVTIGALGIEGLAGRAVRDAQQRIDLTALAGPRGAANDAAPPPVAASLAAADSARPAGAEPARAAVADSAKPDFKVKVEQITLRRAELAFRDEAVKPLTTLTVTDLSADVKDISWPVTGPATFAVSMKMPKSGRVELKGAVTPVPFDIDFESTLRGGTVEPFQPYMPVRARFAGSFNADSRNHVTIDNGTL